MTWRKAPRGICPDGRKIKALRKRLGISQRDFAARYAVTARTLQRAESGERILPELLNGIAAGLRVTIADLTLAPPDNRPDPARPEPSQEQVRLRRTASAREIVAALETVGKPAFLYDIDPDEETAEDLAAAIGIIEQQPAIPEGADLDPAAYVRQLGRLNTLLKRLENKRIRFYIGSYWEPGVVIEEELAQHDNMQYCRVELVCQGVVLIAESDLPHITRQMARKYTDEQIDTSIEELRYLGWHVEDKRVLS